MGAFLIPYLVGVVTGAVPLFYLEVAVGQFMTESGLRAWKICPLFMGIGWATTVIVFFLDCYYNVILAWAFYYLFASFTSELPWVTCGNWWNTDKCSATFSFSPKGNGTTANVTEMIAMTTQAPVNMSLGNMTNVTKDLSIDSVTEYWEHRVLGISSGIDDMGTIKWDLALCLLLAWIVVYVCICKGIRTSGKVMYVTATSPYIFMTILLVRGCTLPGAVDGIIYYLKPDFAKLANIQVWVDAGTQIFFSYSIALGVLTALGSYNDFNRNSYRDCIIFASVNSGTSIFAGFVIFSTLGYMSYKQGIPVSEVAESGPGLAFIAYPTALAEMPVAPLWSVFFFIMVILLGLDSQFVGVEGLIAAFVDEFASTLRRGYRREIFIGIMCFIMFLVGLSMVTNGGMYVFQLFDYYTGSRIILFVAFFECIAVAYLYGINRFYDNLQMMLGFRPNPYMKWCWLVVSPIFCIAVFIMSAINYSELTYDRPAGKYIYPDWAVGIGWALACCSAIWIPLVAVYKAFQYANCRRACRRLIEPEDLKEHQLRPQDKRDDMQDFENRAYEPDSFNKL
ncbi:sodium- and chloride-dependent taurine transporter [Lingula anatina]|uniref:Sodium- and chloride-dependent taurine transporter n=1 Tax=Lingula anatina TaxID=7574 RepID=A0A2R2MLK3_LINAN|nr:sodium- and chloride-dependent taurine transporter [Lingula anatina]|eukprot:XP_023931084.1 sodium- and chloride-dependent taurine transporter [Lingula anatina]